ncbi:right-handed parallel beta-helix repeat-containing protein [Microbulbifer sp. CnH-101-G]|uniref:right-handed parallel beta-helix repeat-containing protein n=1 Tax=Microbulbifer sp. CnH-101-G TaxID=3243393 RepID=UPI004039FF0E
MKIFILFQVAVFWVFFSFPLIGFSKIIYMATDGDDENSGLSLSEPVKTLSRVHYLVDFSGGDTTVFIRGGVYYGETISWTKTSREFKLKLTAYGDEKPVFEGEGNTVFFRLEVGVGECTNVEISRLTISHYASYAILLNGGRDNRSTTWNGCNHIHDNRFIEIGTLFDVSNCPGDCKGYGVVDFVNSDNNSIYNNVFYRAENISSQDFLLHGVYLAHDSVGNKVYDNYFHLVSGDPIRVRDRSSDNRIYNNYADRAGQRAFLSSWHNSVNGEQASYNNVVENNIVTFPYTTSENIDLTANLVGSGDESTFVDEGQKYFHGAQIDSEEVVATAAGDFDGDGVDELLVAFNYGTFSKVVRAIGGQGKYLKDVLYISPYLNVTDFAVGNFSERGKDEVITAFELDGSKYTIVFRGDGESSLLNYGLIYSSERVKVSAMTSGDFDGDGVSEVVTALKVNSDETKVFRGDGVRSILNLGSLYSLNNWDVTAMTSGDFSGVGRDQVITAYKSSFGTRIYRGEGTSSVVNYGYFYSSFQWAVSDMEANRYNNSVVPSLVTAFRHESSGDVKIYNADGINSATTHSFYDSTIWDISVLTSGVFDKNGEVSLVTSFTTSFLTHTQIWAGNGTTSALNNGIFHRLDLR